ncbi:MAG: electron transfer flavoprotein subunit alpha/FixB family protein [Deltaproteobacteria bacterium]|nr:electron transfer flavoprotein subunit alpha/FixB family protein [Deltaproteobacteria bacterium]
MSGILVVAEHDNGVFRKTANELIGKAAALAGVLGTSVTAVVLGTAPAADLGAYGVTKVVQVEGDFSSYSTAAATAALAAVIESVKPDVVLAAAATLGRDAIPRVAARLGTGVASEVTDLRVEAGAVVGRRPMYSGKVFADVKVTRSPAFFTVRPNSFPQPARGTGQAAVTALAAPATSDGITIIEKRAPSTATVDLTVAERIVSGGRSLKSKEQFDAVVRPLAASLGATVGASRAAVDAGYAAHSEQVGQTGKVVNPTLYVAVGISGAIQHLAGMRTSKVIVAINKDADAPIFEHATYGLVGDLFEIAPKLAEAFRAS